MLKDFEKEQCNRLNRAPYVIVNNHPELNISVKGFYNYINQQVLLVRDIDLKRKVKFKPRKNTIKYFIETVVLFLLIAIYFHLSFSSFTLPLLYF